MYDQGSFGEDRLKIYGVQFLFKENAMK